MKKLVAIIMAAAVAFMVTGNPAYAQKKPNVPEIAKFEAMGGKVIYLGKSYDIDGWLLAKRDGEPHTIIYVSPLGVMLRGHLFSPAGKDITKMQLQIYKQKMSGNQAPIDIPDNVDKDTVPLGEQFYTALDKSNWVRAGVPDAPYVYMLINVNCEHCQSLWRTFKGSVDKGLLQVRIVPLGAEDANLNGGAALLSVDNAADAWQKYMDGNKGALDKTLIKGDALDRMAANNKLMKKWKPPQIPMTVYRKVTDGTVMVVPGQPSNPMLIMPDLMKIEGQ